MSSRPSFVALARSFRPSAVFTHSGRTGVRALVLALAVVLGAGFAGPAPVWAQDSKARLVGTLTAAESGDPVVGATVEIAELERSAVSDERGRFVLRGLPAGTWTLAIRFLGRAARTETVDLSPGAERVLDLTLEVEPIELRPVRTLLKRVRLLGDPSDIGPIPGSAHYLGAEELQGQGFLYDDVHTILRQAPGVNVQEEEGYGLRPNIGMRGTGSERSSRITVMEDGVLIAPAPYAAPSAYYFPVVGRMEAVEVRKGSSQIKYGPRTIGGALNLVSSSIPEDLSGTLDFDGGGDRTRKIRARAGDSYRNFGWLAETYQIRTNGFKQLVGGGDTGFDIQDYVVKLRANTDPGARTYQELEVKLGYTDELSNETYLGLADEDFDRTPDLRYAASQRDVMDAEHSQIQLRHFIRPGGTFDLTTTAYRNDFARNWYKLQSVNGTGISSVLAEPEAFAAEMAILRGGDSPDGALRVRANNREYYAQGLQTVAGFRFDAGDLVNELEVGLRYHEDEEDRFQHEDAYRMAGGTMVLTESGAPGSQSNRVSDARAWAFFVQHRLAVGKWTFTPGLRYETVSFTRTDYATDDPDRTAPTGVRENSVNAVIPGLGASYELDRGVHLFGGVHRGFGPPGPGAADETRPEESINYELGARFRRGALHVQAVGFLSDYRNILGRSTLAVGESGAGELFNGGEVDVRGLELSADWDPLRGGAIELPISLAYTYTHGEFGTAFESDFEPWGTVEAGDRLPYLPEHQLFASIGVSGARWETELSATHNSAMRTVAGQGSIPEDQRTDAFLVLNLSAEYTLAQWSSLFLAVDNLTDERYVVARRPAGARPALPRTIMAGVRLSR